VAAYDRCWARTVSACGEGMSREHYITRGVFPDVNVTIDGTSPLPLDQRETHIDKLVARTLCKRHNQQLSPLDDAFIDLVNCLRETERLRKVRRAIPRKHWPATRLTVDGPAIERCILKTMMNVSTVQREPLAGWRPPDWVASVVLGHRTMPEYHGLAIIARVGDTMTNVESIGVTFGKSERSSNYESVLVDIRGGYRFICTWDRSVKTLGQLRLPGGRYQATEDVIWHPRRFNAEHDGRDLGLSIDFDWSGRWSPGKHRNVVALRGRYAPPPR
jgi:hypothetical protein